MCGAEWETAASPEAVDRTKGKETGCLHAGAEMCLLVTWFLHTSIQYVFGTGSGKEEEGESNSEMELSES